MGKEGLKLRNKSHVNHKSAIKPLWAGEEFFPFLKTFRRSACLL